LGFVALFAGISFVFYVFAFGGFIFGHQGEILACVFGHGFCVFG